MPSVTKRALTDMFKQAEMNFNSSILNTTSPTENQYAAVKTFMLSLTIILIFVAAIGNALTIAAVSRFKNLQYPSNMMIAALAVNDFLASSVFSTLNLVRRHMPFLFKVRSSCLAVLFVNQTLALTTVVFQSVLSMERFYAVQFPYYYHAHVTTKKHLACNIIITAVLVVISLPVFFGIDHWSDNAICYTPLLFPVWYSRIIASITFCFSIFGLLAFFRVVFAEIKFRMRDRILVASEAEKQASLQSTLTILAYGISMCFYLPHVLYYYWSTTMEIQEHDPTIQGIFELLDVSNMAVNCFIYGLKNTKFREAYKCLLGFKNSRVQSIETD